MKVLELWDQLENCTAIGRHRASGRITADSEPCHAFARSGCSVGTRWNLIETEADTKEISGKGGQNHCSDDMESTSTRR